ncbi:hypothetical protein Trydic_g15920 [Trypoxylus dichotomus]
MSEARDAFSWWLAKHDRPTLISIIKNWIHKGSTIIFDYKRACDTFNNEGYEHSKVNHSGIQIRESKPTALRLPAAKGSIC